MKVTTHRGRRGAVAMSILAISVLVLASACGKSTSSSPTTASGSTTGSTPAPSGTWSVTKDATIAAEVPADVASAGTVVVATDATYAPNEFVPAGGTTLDGMDIDLGEAIGDVLGLKWEFTNASFDTIIPGLASGKYGIGMSSFTDTLERQKTVDFVTYFSAGTSFYVAASGGSDVEGLDSLCGLSVGAERGTTQADDSTAQSAKCVSEGKEKVDVQVFTDQNGANLALSSGRVDVVMADSPVAAYAVKQSAGQFKLSGTPYGTAPYGIAIPAPPGRPRALRRCRSRSWTPSRA